MKRENKKEVVKQLKDILSDSSFVVVLKYKGLTAGEMTELRDLLREKKANLRIVKNTLAKIAVKDTKHESLTEYLKDQVAISYSKDPVGLANVLVNFSKEKEIVEIKTGFLEDKIVDMSVIKSLSALGSFEDVRASLVGMLSAPVTNLVRLLKAPSSKLATILNNYVSAKS